MLMSWAFPSAKRPDVVANIFNRKNQLHLATLGTPATLTTPIHQNGSIKKRKKNPPPLTKKEKKTLPLSPVLETYYLCSLNIPFCVLSQLKSVVILLIL